MMRVWWEEWRAGTETTRRVLPWLVLFLGATLLVTKIHPGTAFLVLAGAGLWGGFFSGAQKWNEHRALDWVETRGTAPWQYALGKFLGFTSVFGVWQVILAPALLGAAWLWALPMEVALVAWAWVWITAWLAQLIAHLVNGGPGQGWRVLAGCLLATALGATLEVPGTVGYNPFWQIWTLFHDPGTGFDGGPWLTLVTGLAVGWTLFVLVLKRRRS